MMNLLDYTASHGTDTRSRSRGALLLSMLPYGLIYKSDAVAWYRGSNGGSKVSELITEGYIKEYHITGKSKRKSYAIKFLGLTGKGLCYLAATYGDDYPWLRTIVADIDNREGEISFRNVGANETVRMILRIQSANIFFNRAGATTIIDRLRCNPYQALCAMRVLTNNVTMQHSFLVALADALEAWLRRVRPAIRRPPPDDYDRGAYYDAIEMRVPELNPYTTANYLCEPEDYLRAEDKSHYRTSYIGVLRVRERVYFVYRSSRDGATWNGGSIRSNWGLVAQQLRRLGLLQNPALASYSFPAIMLVDGTGQGVAAFARVCKDNRRVRRGADKALGRGASAVHVLPMITNSIWLVMAILPLAGGAETIAAQFRRVLCVKRPDLFTQHPLDVEMDLRYQGLPCCVGFDLDIKAINRCLDWVTEHDGLAGAERCGFAIACFTWQVAYYRCLFPDSATIVAVEATDDDTLEAEEYPPPAG